MTVNEFCEFVLVDSVFLYDVDPEFDHENNKGESPFRYVFKGKKNRIPAEIGKMKVLFVGAKQKGVLHVRVENV